MTPEELNLEYIKIAVSVATPVTILIVGFLLNRSLQSQAKIEESRRSLNGRWADDFAEEARQLNEAVTTFIMIYLEYRAYLMLNKQLGEDAPQNPQPKVVEQHLRIQRCATLLSRFYRFAPQNGEKLKICVDAMIKLAGQWGSRNGGEPKEFLERQNELNGAVRAVHSELLGLYTKIGATAPPPAT